MARIIRKPFKVDGDVTVKAAVERYRQLREWKEGAVQEMRELQEKLAVVLDEHDANELTIGGVPIARLTEYDVQTVSAKELIAKHPRIAKALVKLTHIVRVDVP